MRIVLINMPFASVYRPSIGIGLLQSALEKRGIACQSLYLNLEFASIIGSEAYDHLSEYTSYPTNALAGDWIFTQSLFGIDNFDEYRDYLLTTFPHIRRKPDTPDRSFKRLLDIRSRVEAFLEQAVEKYDWHKYDVIGFTTVFQQNTAALSLARRLKRKFPDKFIIFGGANVEGHMGLGTLNAYDFVDAVCSGEGDNSFIAFIEALREKRDPSLCRVPGITLRADFGAALPPEPSSAAPVHDMDSLPYPDYDDYFEQFESFDLPENERKRRLLFESSRGCWWGQKSHCLFCGLNGSTLKFRSKSAERALKEILYLRDRYHAYTNKMTAVDNIIDMDYFKTLLPEIRDRDLDLDMFYETKANLTKEQIQLFKQAGFHYVQPGIESVITSVLKLMRKGVSMLQNVRLLKWCAEFSITPLWNFLYGFPGENAQEYDETSYLIPTLTHLMPPGSVSPIRLDRFSPYYTSARHYGIHNIRPLRSYELVYPSLSSQDRMNIAYHFDFDYVHEQNPADYTKRITQAIRKWQSEYQQSEFFSVMKEGSLILVDTRSVALRPTTLLSPFETAVYLECDNMISSLNVTVRLKEKGMDVSEKDVHQCLMKFVRSSWMLTEGDVFLSLAIPLGNYSPKKAGLQRLMDITSPAPQAVVRASS